MSPDDYFTTDAKLKKLASEQDSNIKDNSKYKYLEPFYNEEEHVEIFLNNFQLEFEDMLTNTQCRNIRTALGSSKESIAIEQNSFDESWRYCTRYCLLAFGTKTADKKNLVEGVYVEFDTDITEETFDEISIAERLNWFRYKAMDILVEQKFLHDFGRESSLSEVSQTLISR